MKDTSIPNTILKQYRRGVLTRQQAVDRIDIHYRNMAISDGTAEEERPYRLQLNKYEVVQLLLIVSQVEREGWMFGIRKNWRKRMDYIKASLADIVASNGWALNFKERIITRIKKTNENTNI